MTKSVHLDSYIQEAIRDFRTAEYVLKELKIDIKNKKPVALPLGWRLSLRNIKTRITRISNKSMEPATSHIRNYYKGPDNKVVEAMNNIIETILSKDDEIIYRTKSDLYNEIIGGSEPFDIAIEVLEKSNVLIFDRNKGYHINY